MKKRTFIFRKKKRDLQAVIIKCFFVGVFIVTIIKIVTDYLSLYNYH